MDSEDVKEFYADPSFEAKEEQPEYKPEDFGPQPAFDASGKPMAFMQDPNAPKASVAEEYVKAQMEQAIPEGEIPPTEVAAQTGVDEEFIKAMQRAEAGDFAKRMGLVPMAIPQRTQATPPVVRRPQPQAQTVAPVPTQRYPAPGTPYPPGQPAPQPQNGHRAPPPQQRPAIPPRREELEPGDPRSLVQQLIDYAQEVGAEAAAKELGSNVQTIRMWWSKNAKTPSATHLERFLQIRSTKVNQEVNMDLVEGQYSIGASQPKLNVMLTMPVTGQITPAVELCHLYLAKTYGVRIELMVETMLVRARNFLAEKFLASTCEWCLTVDKDIIFGIGNEQFFRRATQSTKLNAEMFAVDSLARILSHGQPLVGGLYSGRGFGAPLVIAPDMLPRSQADRDLADQIRQGQHRNHLVEVDWLAAGFLLIHRSVFEAIKQKFPELKSQYQDAPFNFWTPRDAEGEDVAFSMRAKACGFVPKLDPGCVVGHIGQMCFMPEHTGAPVPMRTLR